MSLFQAFSPCNQFNKTVSLTVGTSSSTVNVSSFAATNAVNYRVLNSGTNIIFLEITQPGIAVTASTTTSMAMLPNSVEVFTATGSANFTAISSATGNTLYITPGEGL